MKDIVFVCGEICQLGVLDGSDVLYIEKTEPKQAIKLESYVGKNLPAYATALGKCLLSGLNDDEIRKLYYANLYKSPATWRSKCARSKFCYTPI